MSKHDVQKTLKYVASSKDLLQKEISPIFDSMDGDNSGYVDFREYKMYRFLVDGVTNSYQLKREFMQLDFSNSGKISKSAFLDLFTIYFNDAINILDNEMYKIQSE